MMSEHDIEQLLGGFAADTLTPEERHALYNAALLDQRLFDTLADEQALKELLNDPAVRRRLLEELKSPGTSATDNRLSWLGWFRRPAGLAFAGGLAAVIFAVAFGTKMYQESLDRAAQSTATEATTPAAVPPAPASEPARATPHPLQTPADTPASTGSAPIVSARALFYGGEANRSDQRAMAEHKAADAAASPTPLGVRYSFIVRGHDGQEREAAAATAAKNTEPARLTVEATQDAYLQVLKTVGTSGARLWWPQQETGKISLKLLARRRTDIPLPPPSDNEPLTLTIRLSPKPFGPLTIQEAAMLDRFSADLLIESVTPGGAAGLQEQATYVVSRTTSSTSQIAVKIPFGR
jgi:cytoskeletal protein RodZ